MIYPDQVIVSTNAGVANLNKAFIFFASVCLLNGGLGTSSALSLESPAKAKNYDYLDDLRYTSSRLDVFQPYISHSHDIYELRRKTGLTWDNIADLFGVSRRSVHFWANGKPMEDYREEKLQSLLLTIRKIDTGFAVQTRHLLLAKDESGISLFDLLKKGDFYSANLRIPLAGIRQTSNFKPLSQKARAELEPLISPVDLLNANNSRIETKKARVSVAPIRKIKHKS